MSHDYSEVEAARADSIPPDDKAVLHPQVDRGNSKRAHEREQRPGALNLGAVADVGMRCSQRLILIYSCAVTLAKKRPFVEASFAPKGSSESGPSWLAGSAPGAWARQRRSFALPSRLWQHLSKYPFLAGFRAPLRSPLSLWGGIQSTTIAAAIFDSEFISDKKTIVLAENNGLRIS
jgi:hypothetical protein